MLKLEPPFLALGEEGTVPPTPSNLKNDLFSSSITALPRWADVFVICALSHFMGIHSSQHLVAN